MTTYHLFTLDNAVENFRDALQREGVFEVFVPWKETAKFPDPNDVLAIHGVSDNLVVMGFIRTVKPAPQDPISLLRRLEVTAGVRVRPFGRPLLLPPPMV